MHWCALIPNDSNQHGKSSATARSALRASPIPGITVPGDYAEYAKNPTPWVYGR